MTLIYPVATVALTNNPNKTKGIERRWVKEINRRFNGLKRGALAIPLQSLTTNVSTEQQGVITRFMAQLDLLIQEWILGESWQQKYQIGAYTRGVTNTVVSLQNQVEIGVFKAMALAAEDQVMLNEIHRNELAFLTRRADRALNKWVADMAAQVESILHESIGVVSVDDIHDQIADRINATTSRAYTIAGTEVSQAAQRATVKQAQVTEQELDEEVKLVWITVADGRVRDLHASWHGKVMSQEQAARNITISPFNCRCGLKPVVGNLPPKKVKQFAAERKQLLKMEAKKNAH